MRLIVFNDDGEEEVQDTDPIGTIHSGIRIVVDSWLEDYSLEDFLEELDITPAEAIIALYDAGKIDEDTLERFLMEV